MKNDINERIIAFIDILGFRDMVIRSPDLKDFVNKYLSIFHPLSTEIQTYGIIYRLFSDSLVIGVSNRKEEYEIRSLLGFCQNLLKRAIHSELPVRGAISRGKVFWKDEAVVGVPIIEAVEYELRQEWMGIVLTPSATRYFLKNRFILKKMEDEKYIRLYDNIPFKNHKLGEHNTVSGYVVDILGNDNNSYEELIKSLNNMKIENGDFAIQQKYEKTIEFLKYCKMYESSFDK